MTQTGMEQTQKARNAWFGALVLAGLVAVMTPAILLAAGRLGGGEGFDAVVRGIETRYHVHATRIPFMGLISAVAGASTHGGVRGLHVAEIENFSSPVDGAELNALIEQRVGQGWERIVRETSRDGAEQTLIYAKPDGERMAMLIVDLDHQEMDVVQVSADPDRLNDEISRHRHDKAKETGDGDEKKPDTEQDKSDTE
jgi:hypothetical protein